MKKLIPGLICSMCLIFTGAGCIPGEIEGYVEYDDCRETIYLEDDSSSLYRNYICDYDKTESGKMMQGVCVHVIVNDDNTCRTAYIYEKKPEVSCDKEHPYLGYDDKCYEEWDSGRVRADK